MAAVGARSLSSYSSGLSWCAVCRLHGLLVRGCVVTVRSFRRQLLRYKMIQLHACICSCNLDQISPINDHHEIHVNFGCYTWLYYYSLMANSQRGDDVEIICPSAEELSLGYQTDIPCPIAWCGRVFPQSSALRFHMIKVHRIIEVQCWCDVLVIISLSRFSVHAICWWIFRILRDQLTFQWLSSCILFRW